MEQMHLQENTVFDLGFKVTQDVSQHPLHHVTYAFAKFDSARCIYKKNTVFDLDHKVRVTCDVAQYHLHHETYAHAKFEVAVSDGLGDAFTRKFII